MTGGQMLTKVTKIKIMINRLNSKHKKFTQEQCRQWPLQHHAPAALQRSCRMIPVFDSLFYFCP